MGFIGGGVVPVMRGTEALFPRADAGDEMHLGHVARHALDFRMSIILADKNRPSGATHIVAGFPVIGSEARSETLKSGGALMPSPAGTRLYRDVRLHVVGHLFEKERPQGGTA